MLFFGITTMPPWIMFFSQNIDILDNNNCDWHILLTQRHLRAKHLLKQKEEEKSLQVKKKLNLKSMTKHSCLTIASNQATEFQKLPHFLF